MKLYGKGTLKRINDNWGHIFNPQKIYDFRGESLVRQYPKWVSIAKEL